MPAPSLLSKILPYRNQPIILGYILPMMMFMVLTNVESLVPESFYVGFYGLKIAVVTGLLMFFRQPWRELKWDRQSGCWAIVIGVLVFLQWVGIENNLAYPHLGARLGYNPFESLTGLQLPIFLILRFWGLVVMVPIMEEIFWRSFLLRYIRNSNFTSLKLGDANLTSFMAVAVGFALFHSEWLVAFITAILYGGLMLRTRSLGACIIAHGLTNFLLGLYILWAQDWKFW